MPEEVKDVYDEERYLKWKQYSAEKIKTNIIVSSITFLVTLGLIISDVFAFITKDITNHYLTMLIVLGIYLGVSMLIDFISSYYETMKIEAKYGFNKATFKTFISDFIKKFFITVILFIGLTSLFILIYEAIGDYILIAFSGILVLIIVGVMFLYPILSKAFNKFQSLQEGELRTKLIALLEKNGYKVKDIKVMDASKRTTKSNAYFSGFGKTKTIVLYDNILNVMSEEEIIAVFAHEMGHGLHKDTIKNTFISFSTIIIVVVLAWLMVKFPTIYSDFGFNDINYGFAVILLFECVLVIVSLLMNLLSMHMSRRAEYRADEQAVKEGYGEQLISGLKTLYKEDLGDLNPDPLVVLLSYSHPTLAQRIRHIREFEKSNN